ncbi:DUF3108 domain-containing protein [Polymorphum gilvum]|uniref:DUF3108 domain-containing protein n=1 Tax=Polymorphum gilvum (strain LMG 25793 / CGMCC 1.9160 / SL003B-26A1) TaxID=991905 RepID=F2J213_POLGS|nr:DUF3108 domain-containing protein [Polymorphum gilvum]ADZ68772.1 hypothetical protein SL003B_0337 [Polymorphum gilvum SL003B-26A1]
MSGFRSKRRLFAVPAIAFTLLAGTAEAQTNRIGGLYDITVAGLTIGRGTLSLVLQGNAYSAKVGLEPAGIGTLFSTGKGGAEAAGWLVGSKVMPSRYTMASRAANRDFYVSLTQGSGHIRSADVAPQFKPNKERIEVTKQHRQNAMDPLSAALVPVSVGKDGLGPAACKRKLPVFDGWTRFDIQLSFKETREVSGRGYDGPVVVCSAKWIPVAGHRPSTDSVKHMASSDMEAWFAPMGRKDVLVPYRITIPTRTGQLVVEASKLRLSDNERDQAAR